ncbi:MAG TPA: alpha/beta hydrolase [Pseudomonas sp.]|jgi:sigma-B regulation protein RsbQ
MSVQLRNNVNVLGDGGVTLIFAHGFGCDQTMWRFMAPHFATSYTVILFDLVGSGCSDLSAYYPRKYDSLAGYASDLLEIIDEFGGPGPVIYIGHSVSAMIGVLADLQAPGRVAAHVMIGPSPCYINDGDYIAGFTRRDIESLLQTLDSNYKGWASTMAPAIMGAAEQPELGEELTSSFCRTDAQVARQFARVTFMSDHRKDVARITTKTLIVQCSDDLIAPVQVGDFLHRAIPGSTLRVIDNIGHCPHMSSPSACIDVIDDFLRDSGARACVR